VQLKRGVPAKADSSTARKVVEVFYRPPENFLEGTTLLTVLRRRLNPTP
jgi:hypothetical protein